MFLVMSLSSSMEFHDHDANVRLVRQPYQQHPHTSSDNDRNTDENFVAQNGQSFGDLEDVQSVERLLTFYRDEMVSKFSVDEGEPVMSYSTDAVLMGQSYGQTSSVSDGDQIETVMQNGYYQENDDNDDMDKNASTSMISTKTDRWGFIYPKSSTISTLPVGTLRKRENKWLHMLDNWPYYMNKKFDTVKTRCRKGIPDALRGRAWKYLSGAQHRIEFNGTALFERLDDDPGNQRWVDDIGKDLFRQFPEHEMFAREGPYGRLGREDLFRLLKAYTVMFPNEGYCQGQAPVAATLLMHMPLMDAFYCFIQICTRYLPGYYSPGLEAIQLDGDIIFQLLKKKSPRSYKHLRKHHIDPVLYMIEWFMCVFCRTLPWPSVLRVWDMFFCEGVKVLFKVAIVLFRYGLSSAHQLKECNDLASTVERLKHLPQEIMEEDFLVARVVELEVNEEDLERIHYKQLKLREKAKRKLSKP